MASYEETSDDDWGGRGWCWDGFHRFGAPEIVRYWKVPLITSQTYKQYNAATPIFLRLKPASRIFFKKIVTVGAASLGGETVWTIVQGKAAWLIQMEIALRCKLKLFLFSVDNPLSCLDLAS